MCNGFDAIGIPQNVVIEFRMPQWRGRPHFLPARRALLERRHERQKIRTAGPSSREKMQVIRHGAVRVKHERVPFRERHQAAQDYPCKRDLGKISLPVMATNRDEIDSAPHIVLWGQSNVLSTFQGCTTTVTHFIHIMPYRCAVGPGGAPVSGVCSRLSRAEPGLAFSKLSSDSPSGRPGFSPCSARRARKTRGTTRPYDGERATTSVSTLFAAMFLALLSALCALAQNEPTRPKITGIAYVRVYAADLNKSREFYRSILGLGGDTTGCVSAGASCFSVNGRQSIGLAQITAGTPDNLLAEVAFSTPDVPGMQRYLAAHNVATKPVMKNAAGRPYFSLQDPEGHPIAFVQDSGEGFFTPKSEQVSARLLHAGFIVKDHETEDRFYRGLLGFRMYWHGGFKDADMDWEELQVPDGSEWIEYMLNIPASADGKERGIQNHFSLGVLDIKSALTRLRAHGLKVEADDKPEIGRDGKWSWDIYDPDATRVEFMEFKPTQAPCCHPYEAAHPRP